MRRNALAINQLVVSTHKILCVFYRNSIVSDIVGQIISSKNQSMRIRGSNYRIIELPCWTSTSKTYNLSFDGIHEIIMFKPQSFPIWDIFL